MKSFIRICATLAAIASLGASSAAIDAKDGKPALPRQLRDTGLYVAGSVLTVRAENMQFSPQYPLWSDGAAKRRWLYLPPGTSIDASNPDAWEFPRGTRMWKEFSHGQPVETRFIERLADGSWRYATYIWNADGTDAMLAPATGILALPVKGAPGGRYDIPAEADCRACHEGAAVPVLGVSALQLSPDRDPLAAHAERSGPENFNLREMVARGLLRNLPPALIVHPPRVAAATPASRAALGYLHANCGHCHNETGPLASLDLDLAQSAIAGPDSVTKPMNSIVGQTGRYRPNGNEDGATRIVAGNEDRSLIVTRMRSRNALTQMPPLGTRVADTEALALIEHWIKHDLQPRKETTP